jgi:hypothetical protein
MSQWQYYQKVAKQAMRPYITGEDLSDVSVSKEDTPRDGGMIAVSETNSMDKWYIAEDFFKRNYKPAE